MFSSTMGMTIQTTVLESTVVKSRSRSHITILGAGTETSQDAMAYAQKKTYHPKALLGVKILLASRDMPGKSQTNTGP